MPELIIREPTFVPLHVHSQYSILDATASVSAIAKKAESFGLPAVALTDHGNLYGAVDFYKACKEVKVKPIFGVEFWVAPESRFDKKKEYNARSSSHLTLLAKNQEGYKNLSKLSSRGFLEGFYYHPRIDLDLLKEHTKGIICLSGCVNGQIAKQILSGSADLLKATAQFYLDLFGDDFYFEVQRHTMSDDELQADGMAKESWLMQAYLEAMQKEEKVVQECLRLGRELGVKVVATKIATTSSAATGALMKFCSTSNRASRSRWEKKTRLAISSSAF